MAARYARIDIVDPDTRHFFRIFNGPAYSLDCLFHVDDKAPSQS
jgi:hypothetical protein